MNGPILIQYGSHWSRGHIGGPDQYDSGVILVQGVILVWNSAIFVQKRCIVANGPKTDPFGSI